MLKAIETTATMSGVWSVGRRRIGARGMRSVTTPSAPETKTEQIRTGTSGKWRVVFASQPAYAPAVSCAAMLKLTNPSTLKINVSPSAGSAISAPTISPFTKYCSRSFSIATARPFVQASTDLAEDQLAVLHLFVTEEHALHVPVVGEFEAAARPVIVHAAAAADQLERLDGVVRTFGFVVLRDGAQVVAHRLAVYRTRLCVSERERGQHDVIVDLAGVTIEGRPVHLGDEMLVGTRVFRRGRNERVGPFRDFRRNSLRQSVIDAEGKAHLLARKARPVEILQHDGRVRHVASQHDDIR